MKLKDIKREMLVVPNSKVLFSLWENLLEKKEHITLVESEIESFVNAAALAQYGGFDGVEIMGSEGYLINQFLTQRANVRDDRWGGSYENRMRFPVEVIRRVRERCGPNFIIVYRLSMLDLVPDGSTWEEVVLLAKAIEKAGATIINTGMKREFRRLPPRFRERHLLGFQRK